MQNTCLQGSHCCPVAVGGECILKSDYFSFANLLLRAWVLAFFSLLPPSEINVISISKLKAKCHNVNQLEKASLIGYNEYNYNIPGAVK